MAAGKQFYKYSFQKRIDSDDGAGNKQGDWQEAFVTRGSRQFFKGREKVISAAETGTQELIIRVRRSSNTDLVTTAWRILDVRSLETYNIRAVEIDEGGRRYVEFLVQSGVSDG